MSKISEVLVAVRGKEAHIRLVHRADCRVSPDVSDLIISLKSDGVRSMTLDLSDCQLMDSTFLGMLAGFEAPNGTPALPPFGLYRPSSKVLNSLADLDIERFFHEVDEILPDDLFEKVPLRHGGDPQQDLARHSLKAHRDLMKLSPSRAERFRAVTELLERTAGNDPDAS